MSQPIEQTQQYPYAPAPVKKRKPWLLPLVAALALIVGAAGGAAANTKAPETVTVEKQVKVNVPTTPTECRQALGYAEDIISSATRTIGYLSDALSAAGRLDAASIYAASDKVKGETGTLDTLGPKYRAARDTCNSK